MKLALHRSITFWSGILVMAFIGWAWLLSQGTRTNARWRNIQISSHDSVIEVGWFLESSAGLEARNIRLEPDPFIKERLPTPFIRRGGELPPFVLTDEQLGMEFHRGRPLPQSLTRRDMRLWEMQNFREDYWMAYLPYWMISVVSVVLWSIPLALLAFRSKRISLP